MVDDLVHEAGDIVLEGGGDLFDEVGSFLFFLFELVLEQSQFLVHDLDELVLFVLALDDLPFDFGGQKLGELLQLLQLILGLIFVDGIILARD